MEKNKLYNEIVITSDTWEDKTAERLGYTLMTLMGEGEVCKVYDDDTGIYIIQHNHNEDKEYWGGPVCEWMTDEEREDLEARRNCPEENDDEDGEPTFGTVAAEFYFEATQLLDKYQGAELTGEETLQRLIGILNKAKEETNGEE